MSQHPFQVLLLPYRILKNHRVLYAILKRGGTFGGYWQGIAGGSESGESPFDAAKREAFEEAAINPDYEYVKLDSQAIIPVVNVRGFKWGKDVLVIPEYCFGVKVEEEPLQLSNEHTAFRWVGYTEALTMLYWDSNKCALWELNHTIRRRFAKKSVGAVEALIRQSTGFEPPLPGSRPITS